MTKHDAMKAYFEEKVEDLAGAYLGFNFSAEKNGGISFITNYSDKIIKRYVRIGAENFISGRFKPDGNEFCPGIYGLDRRSGSEGDLS